MNIRLWIILWLSFLFVINIPITDIDFSTPASAQGGDYKTPVGSDWTLDDIMADDPSVVTQGGGYYNVHENITIDFGATFTIEPGTRIRFDRSTSMTVRGKLIAKGTGSDRITCTSGEASPGARDWNGFIFEYRSENNDRSILEYVDIEYSNNGVTCRAAAPTLNQVSITKCQNGIYGDSTSSPRIFNSEITDNNFWGLRLSGAETEISNCTISGNYYGIFSQDSKLVIGDNTIDNNTLYGLLLRDDNSILKRNTISFNGQSLSGLYPGIRIVDSDTYSQANRYEYNTHAGIEAINSTLHSSGDLFLKNLVGINPQENSMLIADNIDIMSSREHGLRAINSTIKLTSSNVSDNGWGTVPEDEQFTGVFINRGYGYLDNNVIDNNAFMGIALEYSDADIESGSIYGNNMDGIYCWYSSPIIKNTTIINSGRYEIFVDDGANPAYVNYLGNESNINIVNGSSIAFGFSFSASITDKNGDPIENAYVEIFDKSRSGDDKNRFLTSGYSDDDGKVPALDIYYKIVYHDHELIIFNLSNISPQGIAWGLTGVPVKNGYAGIEAPVEGKGGQSQLLVLDKVPELILTTSENDYSGVISGTLILEGAAKDEDDEVRSVLYKIDNDLWRNATLTAPSSGSGEYKFRIDWDTRTVTTGIHEMTIKALDGTGYSNPIELALNVDNPEGLTDNDGDGLTYAEEIGLGTDPENPDSDSDGLSDGIEIDDSDGNTTDPLNDDTDSDGLLDGREDRNGNGRVEVTETDPNNEDTDGDTVSDSKDRFPLDSTRWKADGADDQSVYFYFSILMVVVIIIIAIMTIVVFLRTKQMKEQYEYQKVKKVQRIEKRK